jgi:hypothetical protein
LGTPDLWKAHGQLCFVFASWMADSSHASLSHTHVSLFPTGGGVGRWSLAPGGGALRGAVRLARRRRCVVARKKKRKKKQPPRNWKSLFSLPSWPNTPTPPTPVASRARASSPSAREYTCVMRVCSSSATDDESSRHNPTTTSSFSQSRGARRRMWRCSRPCWRTPGAACWT